VALIQIFLFHALRIVYTYKISYLLFENDKISKLASSLVAFNPYILRWDLVIMKESFFLFLIILSLYFTAKFTISRSKINSILYFFGSIFITYLIYLDRFYFGIVLFVGIIISLNLRKKRSVYHLLKSYKIYLTLFLLCSLILYISYDYIVSYNLYILISNSSLNYSNFFTGLLQILLTPLPFRATVHYDVNYLAYYGWIIYYPILIYFLLGFVKLMMNRSKLFWFVCGLLLLLIILAYFIPGGERRRDCFLPVMCILSAYGFTRNYKNSYFNP